MSLSVSPLSYIDCYAIMDAAVRDSQGVRVNLPDRASAVHLRMRCHQARKIDRALAKEVHEKGDPRWGVCQYDSLILQIYEEEGNWWLSFKRTDHMNGRIESLSGEEVQLTVPMLSASPEALPTPSDDFGTAFEEVEAVEEPKHRRF